MAAYHVFSMDSNEPGGGMGYMGSRPILEEAKHLGIHSFEYYDHLIIMIERDGQLIEVSMYSNNTGEWIDKESRWVEDPNVFGSGCWEYIDN